MSEMAGIEKPVVKFCGHCGSAKTAPHCANPACTWVSCHECGRTTDVSGLAGDAECA